MFVLFLDFLLSHLQLLFMMPSLIDIIENGNGDQGKHNHPGDFGQGHEIEDHDFLRSTDGKSIDLVQFTHVKVNSDETNDYHFHQTFEKIG